METRASDLLCSSGRKRCQYGGKESMHGTCSASGAISFPFITLQMHLLIGFFCMHRRIPVLSLLQLSCLLARSRMARRQILCSRMWIPIFLFPPKAGVLLDIVTSRRSFRRAEGIFASCFMSVAWAAWLVGHTYTVSRNPLRLNRFHWRWRRLEANELVQLRSLRPPLHGRLGPRRSVKVPCLFVSQII